MKTTALIKHQSWQMGSLLAVILLFLSSCETETFNRYGFDCTFEKNSTGLTLMGVNRNASTITLNGEVFMDTGEMKVEFVDPDGYIVYTRNFFAPGNYFVTETFKASQGIWKLRYTSIDGTGSIDLHASYR